MIAMDGHLVLADFGLAWRLEERGEFPMTCVGTPEYSAPEVLQEKPYGMEVDLWSFGVILFEMLARQVSNCCQRDLTAHLNLTPIVTIRRLSEHSEERPKMDGMPDRTCRLR